MAWTISKTEGFRIEAAISGPAGHRCAMKNKSSKVEDFKVASQWIWQNEFDLGGAAPRRIILFIEELQKSAQLKSNLPSYLSFEIFPNSVRSLISALKEVSESDFYFIAVGAQPQLDYPLALAFNLPKFDVASDESSDQQLKEGLLRFQTELANRRTAEILTDFKPGKPRVLNFSRINQSEINSRFGNHRRWWEDFRTVEQNRSGDRGWGIDFLRGNAVSNRKIEESGRKIYFERLHGPSRKLNFSDIADFAWGVQKSVLELGQNRQIQDIYISCSLPNLGHFLRALIKSRLPDIEFPCWTSIGDIIWGQNPVLDVFEFLKRPSNSLLIVLDNAFEADLIWTIQA